MEVQLNIITAGQAANLTKENIKQLELNALSSTRFRELANKIETAALAGETSAWVELGDTLGNRKYVEVWKRYLNAAGYEIQEEVFHDHNIKLIVSWDHQLKAGE